MRQRCSLATSRAASGSMRDALTLADQAISFCQGEVNDSGVIECGVPEQAQVFELLSAMAKGISPCSFTGGDYLRPHARLLEHARFAVINAAPGSHCASCSECCR